jgi:hypothetical protein
MSDQLYLLDQIEKLADSLGTDDFQLCKQIYLEINGISLDGVIKVVECLRDNGFEIVRARSDTGELICPKCDVTLFCPCSPHGT